MTDRPSRMSEVEKSAAVGIIRTLRERGHRAYLVGGCVRDILLGREPADYDVSTDATPDQVMRIFPRTWAVGAQFGVVLVPVDDQISRSPDDQISGSDLPPALANNVATRAHAIEVATFRSDGLYTDGQHPNDVTFSKEAKEDVQRRDFTINGLLLDPTDNQVLDYAVSYTHLRAHETVLDL